MKYLLSAMVTVSAFTEVDADSEQEAIEIAKGRAVIVSERGTGEEEWVITEGDGEPQQIRIEPTVEH